MLLTVTYPLLPKRNSVRASLVMDHFGIGHDSTEHVLARDLEVPLQPGDVVLFTGASGSGKSSLLRALISQLKVREGEAPAEPRSTNDAVLQSRLGRSLALPHADSGHSPSAISHQPDSVDQPSTINHQPLFLDLPSLPLGTQTLVDAIPLPFEESLQLLAMCGLGEAPLLLRTPQELSEGQRYRFSLALAVALRPQWIIADEFTAVLDRTTAKVIAYNVRRIADRYGVGFLLATAQSDITADLSPDLCVTCDLDGRVTVIRQTASGSLLLRGEGLGVRAEPPDSVPTPSNAATERANEPVLRDAPRKKKDPRSPSTANSGSAPPPVATGRISLGGIIAVTTSG